MSQALKDSLVGDETRKGLVSFAVKGLVSWLVIQAPFLAWGPIKFILSYFLDKLLRKMLDQGVIKINHLIINLNIDGKVIKHSEARLKAIELVQKEGVTDAELDAIDEELKNAARDLIRYSRTRL